MNLKGVLFAATAAIVLSSCSGRTDTEIQIDVNKEVAGAEGAVVTASSAKGVVTLSGQCKDQACIDEAVKRASAVKGVKEVVNNITIAALPGADAPVEFAVDDVLNKAVGEVVAGYKNVTAEINDGVVTLKGEIERASLQDLLQKLHTLKPKRIDNQLVVK